MPNLGIDVSRRTPRWIVIAVLAVSGCAHSGSLSAGRSAGDAAFPDIGYASWTDAEPPYRLYPGDVVEVATPSAPELNKEVTVGPDGRVNLPLISPVMVADKTTDDVEAALAAAYAQVLVNPSVEVSVKQAQPLKVFIGGEVERPGVYDMPGPIDALQGVIQAGGFKNSAKRDQVVIIRRGPDGRAMMRTANLKRGISSPATTDTVPLRRFDIIYVPKSTIAEVGAFMSQIREALPIGFSYSLNSPYGN